MPVYVGNMTRLPAFMKIGMIILLTVVISIAQAGNVGFGVYKHSSALGYGITVGYMIVYLILIVCYAIGETGTQRSKFELLLNGVGSILFFSLAIYLFVNASDYSYFGSTETKLIIEGVFLLLTSACQVVDAVFNFRSGDME